MIVHFTQANFRVWDMLRVISHIHSM